MLLKENLSDKTAQNDWEKNGQILTFKLFKIVQTVFASHPPFTCMFAQVSQQNKLKFPPYPQTP